MNNFLWPRESSPNRRATIDELFPDGCISLCVLDGSVAGWLLQRVCVGHLLAAVRSSHAGKSDFYFLFDFSVVL